MSFIGGPLPDPRRLAFRAALVLTGVLRFRVRTGRDMATLIGRKVAARWDSVRWFLLRERMKRELGIK